MRPAIRVDGLSKSYQLGARRNQGYRTLRESLTSSAAGMWRGLTRAGCRFLGKETCKEVTDPGKFWALKDVSFEVQPGEVVGIIGRNGAGKSTLLKILSRITEPTSGRAEVRGRMGSLLEVGTGFHPELTGRENIYLNGSILGMSRREIHRKFDEIVAFSEIEQFLDTPVKRYSSGMYVRLAFAVAAHLEPEILIVDEVLAVGDSQFQKKCMGKMRQVGHDGRTILFVSHNMAAVQNLCDTTAIFDAGSLIAQGPTQEMLGMYFQRQLDGAEVSLKSFENRTGSGDIVFTYFTVEDELGRPLIAVQSGQNVTLVLGFSCPGGPIHKSVNVGFGLHGSAGERLVILYASHTGQEFAGTPASGEFRCRISRFPLNPGRYYLFPRIEVNGSEADFPRDGVGFVDVEAGDFYKTGRQTVDQSFAPFLIDGEWFMNSGGTSNVNQFGGPVLARVATSVPSLHS